MKGNEFDLIALGDKNVFEKSGKAGRKTEYLVIPKNPKWSRNNPENTATDPK